jgi:hypothetical protein
MIRRPRSADILLWIDIDPETASGQTLSGGSDGPRAIGPEFRCFEPEPVDRRARLPVDHRGR